MFKQISLYLKLLRVNFRVATLQAMQRNLINQGTAMDAKLQKVSDDIKALADYAGVAESTNAALAASNVALTQQVADLTAAAAAKDADVDTVLAQADAAKAAIPAA